MITSDILRHFGDFSVANGRHCVTDRDAQQVDATPTFGIVPDERCYLFCTRTSEDRMANSLTGKHSIEHLVHFNCAACHKWWSVGDAPLQKRIWFCPWCGRRQRFDLREDTASHPTEQRLHASE